MAKRIVGLEIGPDAIRAVQVSKSSFGKICIEKISEVPVSGGIDSNGKITNPELIGQLLRNMWKTMKFKTKHVALGLGGTDVFVREFSVPEMKPEQLKGALPSLAEGSLPMPTTELYLDYYPAKNVEKEGNNSVSGLLLAATRASADSLVGVVQSAGLVPDSVDLIPFSLIRQISEQKTESGAIAIVHASAGFLNIIVARGKVPIFVRMVPLKISSSVGEGLESVSVDSDVPPNEIVNEDQIPAEIEDLSTTEILTVKGSEPVSTEFQDAAVRELKDTLTYYSRNHIDEPISTLLTSGKGLDNSEWLTLLGQQIWLPSESHTLLVPYRNRSRKTETISLPTQFLVAFSLAGGALHAK